MHGNLFTMLCMLCCKFSTFCDFGQLGTQRLFKQTKPISYSELSLVQPITFFFRIEVFATGREWKPVLLLLIRTSKYILYVQEVLSFFKN